MNPTNEKIRKLMDERGWKECRLAKETGLPQSTIANFFKRDTTPSVKTLEAICGGFGITLAQFFCDGNLASLTDEQMELFGRWVNLTAEQKHMILALVRQFKQ